MSGLEPEYYENELSYCPHILYTRHKNVYTHSVCKEDLNILNISFELNESLNETLYGLM